MLKRLPMFARGILGIALIVGAIVLVTYEEHHASDKYKRQCQEHNAAIAKIPGAQNPHSPEDCKESKDYMPWWYILVAWPEGITAWLLLFTLGGIIWQAIATAKAAKATEDAVKAAMLQAEHIVGSERAWLLISSVTKQGSVLKPGPPPRFWWRVKNVGGTPARLICTQAICRLSSGDKLPEEPIYATHNIQINERILAPGDFLDFFTFWENEEGSVFLGGVETLDTVWLVAYGYIRYRTTFDEQARESRFCDMYISTPTKPLSVIAAEVVEFSAYLGAPPAYTKHT